jgi:hypothetical protein
MTLVGWLGGGGESNVFGSQEKRVAVPDLLLMLFQETTSSHVDDRLKGWKIGSILRVNW